MTYFNNKSNLITDKVEKTKRSSAFIVTSLCMFVLICLIWPFTVSEFRSVVALNVATGKDDLSKAQLEESLSRIIREETVDERLEAMVAQIEVARKLNSSQIEFRDYDSMRKALQVSISERDYGYDFYLAYDGLGGADERELVQMLATRIALKLNPDKNTPRPTPAANRNSATALVQLHAEQVQSFELAKWAVDQVDNDLKSIKLSLSRMGDSGAGLARQSSEDKNAGSQFQFASSQKMVLEPGDLVASIDSIDLQSLRDILAEMHRRLEQQAILIENRSLVSDEPTEVAHMIVSRSNRITTRPLHGSPGGVGIFLVSLVSVLTGSVVALKLQPFESRGFESARSIGRVLGVPVVAQIRADATAADSGSVKQSISLANRVAMSSGLVLFGICVVVIGFVLINSEVRDAFYENPLFGCAKIVRIFAGY